MFTDEESPYSPGAVVDLANGAFEAWPDAALDVHATIEGSDGIVAVEWTWRGTHVKERRGLPAKGEATLRRNSGWRRAVLASVDPATRPACGRLCMCCPATP